MHRGLSTPQQNLVTQDYYSDGSNKTPRYYQLLAIDKTIEAIAKGQDRILLVMATGTGKTFTAFQIIWRLWKSKTKKRILFLADRNILVDRTMTNNFKPFGSAMTKIQKRQADKSYEIYLSLYQAVTGNEEEQKIYKQFSPDFFYLIVIDECHRGSAAEDSAWRQILDYFLSATQVGLTATPKERAERVKKRDYFTKYGERARRVLESLLDKYADEGVGQIEETQVLTVAPFTQFGTPLEIVRMFGGTAQYQEAIRDLKRSLYSP